MADEIFPPQRNEAWLNKDNTPTLRFAEFIESLTTSSNESITNITTLDDGVSNSAHALAGQNSKELDNLIAMMQAPLIAKIGQLEKLVASLANTTQTGQSAKIGQLEKKIADLETNSVSFPIFSEVELMDLINSQPVVSPSAVGELEKRVNFIEGQM